MSGEIRDWLAGLSANEPRTAAAIAHALTALADTGPDLGPPMIIPLDQPPSRADPLDALDYAYQDQLERLQHLRRAAPETSEVERLQAETDVFRVRMEVLKARHAAATADSEEFAEEFAT